MTIFQGESHPLYFRYAQRYGWRMAGVMPLECLSWIHPYFRCPHWIRQILSWLTASIWVRTVLSSFQGVKSFISTQLQCQSTLIFIGHIKHNSATNKWLNMTSHTLLLPSVNNDIRKKRKMATAFSPYIHLPSGICRLHQLFPFTSLFLVL